MFNERELGKDRSPELRAYGALILAGQAELDVRLKGLRYPNYLPKTIQEK
jgi:hypothetical protein